MLMMRKSFFFFFAIVFFSEGRTACLDKIKRLFITENTDSLFIEEQEKNHIYLSPMRSINLQSGILVSRPNKSGQLEDVIVHDIQKDDIIVSYNKHQKNILEHISKKNIYMPTRRTDFRPYIENDMGLNDLKFFPVKQFGSYQEDFSKPVSIIKLIPMFKSMLKILTFYYGYGRRFGLKVSEIIEENNFFIRQLQKFLEKQGVSTWAFSSSEDNNILNLAIYGVHPNGNATVRKYLRLLRNQDRPLMTVSIIENLESNTAGFNRGQRVDIGEIAAIRILRGKQSTIALHEIRHKMFTTRRKYHRTSIFDYMLYTVNNPYKEPLPHSRVHNNHNFNNISFEEIYLGPFDLFFLAKDIFLSFPPLTSIWWLEFTHQLSSLKNITSNIKYAVEKSLDNVDIHHQNFYLENEYTVKLSSKEHLKNLRRIRNLCSYILEWIHEIEEQAKNPILFNLKTELLQKTRNLLSRVKKELQ